MTAAPTTSCAACHSVAGPDDEFCEACGHGIPPAGGGAPDHLEVDLGPVAAASDVGRRHARNEDAFAVCVSPEGRILAAVCDGVSTTARPERAARAAADAALDALLARPDPEGPDGLEAAYEAAARAVRQIPRIPEEDGTGPPSCTLLVAAVNGRHLWISSVGDCRAFWLPEGAAPRLLTEDDSWAGEQVRAGAMTAEKAHADPRSHSITRWIGRDADPRWTARVASHAVDGPGRLVLCSDGLWNYASTAAEIASALPHGEPATAARSLVEWANARGGQDNVTVVVIEVGLAGEVDRAEQEGLYR